LITTGLDFDFMSFKIDYPVIGTNYYILLFHLIYIIIVLFV